MESVWQKTERQAQFHPRKFLAGIAAGLNIYEHTFVTQLMPGCALTDKGGITYRKAIFATHYPIDNKHGGYFIKLYYQHRSYVTAWEQAAQDCMPLDHAPYIGVYSPSMPECYVTSGFRKWGMTSAMVSAMLLADLIPAERSWDCPCHGSRFAENGKVLDNPANGDKHI